jgi:hypothetical protein
MNWTDWTIKVAEYDIRALDEFGQDVPVQNKSRMQAIIQPSAWDIGWGWLNDPEITQISIYDEKNGKSFYEQIGKYLKDSKYINHVTIHSSTVNHDKRQEFYDEVFRSLPNHPNLVVDMRPNLMNTDRDLENRLLHSFLSRPRSYVLKINNAYQSFSDVMSLCMGNTLLKGLSLYYDVMEVNCNDLVQFLQATSALETLAFRTVHGAIFNNPEALQGVTFPLKMLRISTSAEQTLFACWIATIFPHANNILHVFGDRHDVNETVQLDFNLFDVFNEIQLKTATRHMIVREGEQLTKLRRFIIKHNILYGREHELFDFLRLCPDLQSFSYFPRKSVERKTTEFDAFYLPEVFPPAIWNKLTDIEIGHELYKGRYEVLGAFALSCPNLKRFVLRIPSYRHERYNDKMIPLINALTQCLNLTQVVFLTRTSDDNNIRVVYHRSFALTVFEFAYAILKRGLSSSTVVRNTTTRAYALNILGLLYAPYDPVSRDRIEKEFAKYAEERFFAEIYLSRRVTGDVVPHLDQMLGQLRSTKKT